jgi:GMP synthase PP-ATPase subunit
MTNKDVKEYDHPEIENHANQISGKYGYKANILNVKSVGVAGDDRTYGYVVELEGKYDPEVLGDLSSQITNKVKGVNRVVLKIL